MWTPLTYTDALLTHPDEVGDIWTEFQSRSKLAHRAPDSFSWGYESSIDISFSKNTKSREERTHAYLIMKSPGNRWLAHLGETPQAVHDAWPS